MKFIAFDLETTGLNSVRDRIVEIGAVLFDGAQIVDRHSTLIDPEIPVPPIISEITGITNQMVKGKPLVEDAIKDLAVFCGELPLVAHNAPFDFKFLSEAIKKHQTEAPKGVVLDTLPLTRKIYPGLPNYKLGTLVNHFNFPSGTFHRAEEDSVYCGLLFAKLIQTLEMRGEPFAEEDLIQLTGKKSLFFPQCLPKTDQLDLF